MSDEAEDTVKDLNCLLPENNSISYDDKKNY